MDNTFWTGGLIGAVRRDLSAARQAARIGHSAATAARAAAAAQLEAVHRCVPGRRRLLEEAREEALQQADQRWQRESESLVRALRALAQEAAPGPSGCAWDQWTPATSEPALLRIGTLEGDIPALVPLLDHAHLTLRGESSEVDGVLGGLLLRALAAVSPGSVRISVYDPGQLGGALVGFAPLAPAGIVSYLGPGGLTPLLDDLVEHIRRINSHVLAGAHPSLAALAHVTGRRPEPWRIAVLLADNATELSTAQRAQLDRITRTGVAAGVHLISRGIALDECESIDLSPLTALLAAHDKLLPGVRTSLTGELPVTLDGPPPSTLVSSVIGNIAEEVIAGPPPVPLAALLPEEVWAASSAAQLSAPIGEGTDGRLVDLVLGDDPPHALIGGPSGSGKTNLIYSWLAALSTRYPPEELALYLLDFKEGVSFARFAPSPRDPSWLPQVKLVGLNVNSDREFGLALLRHLAEELKIRAAAAKRFDASKLSELRGEDPDGHWPRIVAVIDEFQVLLGARDSVTSEAVSLLEDLARRGRSQGIHLVLASQDVSGIEALWGRSGLVGQFTLRIALPKARRILAETNLAAELIPRFHAVVNADSGALPANKIVRLPDAGDRDTWLSLQEQLWDARPDGNESPRLFDGDARPLFPLLPPPPPASTLDRHGAVALLGESIDVDGRPATMRLNRGPGRNLVVLGGRVEEACAVLTAAGLSLGKQFQAGAARFSVLCLDEDASAAAKSLHAALPGSTWHDDLGVLLESALSDMDTPHFIFGFAMDAGPSRGHDLLRTVLAKGAERHTHLMCWWRTVARLREDLGGIAARLDGVGAWVALDVHGPELSPLYPQPGGPDWHPRLYRALYFDRSVHRRPEIIIPYEMTL